MSAIVTYPTTENLHADTSKITLDKILQALNGGAGGGGSGGSVEPGVVDPEGAVTGTPGQTYYNSANQTYWVKESGTGNTGWRQLI